MKKVILSISFFLISFVLLSQEHYFNSILDGTSGDWKYTKGVVRVKNYQEQGIYLVSDHDYIGARAIIKWCVKYSQTTKEGLYVYTQSNIINSTADFVALMTDVKLSDMAKGKEGIIYIKYDLLDVVFKCENK